jgi:hypothetical protein
MDPLGPTFAYYVFSHDFLLTSIRALNPIISHSLSAHGKEIESTWYVGQ